MKLGTISILAVVSCVHLFADKIVLQNVGGKNVCEDTYIEETINTPYNEEKQLGLEVGSCPSCHEKRILMRYDLSSLPNAEEITSAKISLYCSIDNSSTGATAEAYYPKADWVANEVDWFESKEGVKWNNEGGDIGLSALASAELADDAKDHWIELDVTKTIKEYVNGDKENRGFLILVDDIDNLYIESSESETDKYRPKLTVYTGDTPIIPSSQAAQNNFTIIQTGTRDFKIVLDQSGNAEIQLHNSIGKLLTKKMTQRGEALVSTKGLAQGSYILSVHQNGKSYSQIIQLRN